MVQLRPVALKTVITIAVVIVGVALPTLCFGISEFRVWPRPRPLGNRSLAAPQGSRMVDSPVRSLGVRGLVVCRPLFCSGDLWVDVRSLRDVAFCFSACIRVHE